MCSVTTGIPGTVIKLSINSRMLWKKKKTPSIHECVSNVPLLIGLLWSCRQILERPELTLKFSWVVSEANTLYKPCVVRRRYYLAFLLEPPTCITLIHLASHYWNHFSWLFWQASVIGANEHGTLKIHQRRKRRVLWGVEDVAWTLAMGLEMA